MSRRRFPLGDRGRVPFALVGALLLVSSALFAATVGHPSAPPEPAVDTAMERTTADARAALRQAVGTASVEAASNPVISPAETAAGDVLSEDDAFEDALKLRIYLTAMERFESIGRTHRGVTTDVSLPQPSNPEALERAKQRVEIQPAGPDNTKLLVRLSNVSQTATYSGETVGRTNVTFSVTVNSPVLAVHDRVSEYENRLDAGLTSPGLTQKMTVRLWATAWARGYAQYGGAPIENVVANKHVGLLTNGAVLEVQRSVFGESDPDGRRALRNAVAGTVLTNAIGRASGPADSVDGLLVERVDAATEPSEQRGIASLGAGETSTAKPNETVTVAVDETAIRAFESFAYQRGGDREFSQTPAGSVPPPVEGTAGINQTIQSVYSERLQIVSAVAYGSGSDPEPPGPPTESDNWVLVDNHTVSRIKSVDVADTGPSVPEPSGYHTLHKYERTVTYEHTFERTWQRGRERRTTSTVETEKRRVTVAVVGNHTTTDHAPANGIELVHEPGGPFNGTNLADMSDRANETIVDVHGGPDVLAKEAARGTLDTQPRTIGGDWPAALPQAAYPELVELRQQLRNTTVDVERAKVGTYEVNPAAKLLERVRSNRSELIDAPATYDTVSERARYELRARYVDRVIQRLADRAAARDERAERFNERVQAEGGGSLELLQDSRAARRVDGDRQDTGDLEFAVDGAPPYLTLSEVTHDQVAAVDEGSSVYPLKAENINVFTIPYGDATDGAVDWVTNELSGEPQTNLRTGAQALGSAEPALETSGNDTLDAQRGTLQQQVNESLEQVRVNIRRTLRRHDVGNSESDRREIVAVAFAQWETPRERALAVSDRSVVGAVVVAAAAHDSTAMSSEMQRDRLRLSLRAAVTRSLDSPGVTVDGPVVEATTDVIKGVVGDRVENATTRLYEERINESIDAMPAGLPIAPVPAHWYVTANVWIVNIHGGYERFAVETPRRTPTAADASLSYVRDGSNVTLDVDGDGHAELLGRADRISFDITAGVVVVVPAGGSGVGDVDGNLQERSPGWSRLVNGNETDSRDVAEALENESMVGLSLGDPTDVSPTARRGAMMHHGTGAQDRQSRVTLTCSRMPN